ncbi:MAG: tetratricopeptide repeat protein [Deferrisomatales bacterium]
MRTRIAAGLLCVALLAAAARAGEGGSAATDRARRFLEAVAAYEAGRYGEAAQAFEALAEGGVENPDLYYNLGNAYWKQGDLGRAILWYERAARLAPGDPDLRYNLEIARSRTRDAAPEEGVDWGRLLFFWRGLLSTRTLWLLAAAFHLPFWGAKTLRLFLGRPWVQRVGWMCLAAGLVLGASAAVEALDPAARALAIVLPEELPVRAGVAPESTELFRLHAGSRVRIERLEGDHVRIRFAQDRIGWVPAEALGRVAR